MSGGSYQFDKSVTDDILARLDLATFIGRYVPLKSSGKDHQGFCPFHQGKSPAFKVFSSNQIFKCFNHGCGVGGNAFKFLMLHEGLSFPQAVKELASEVGVVLIEKTTSPEEREKALRRARIHEALAAASDLFVEALKQMPEGETARTYLKQRGMSAETLETARVGFALDQWNALEDALTQRGFTHEDLTQAGLTRKRDAGDGHYDFFRNRVIFPIRDGRNGKVIGFGGRALEKNARAKYLNSATTEVYDKSRVLYGLYDARKAIQSNKRVIVVEGYFDVLALRQGGFHESVAACGTALRPEHLQLIMPPRRATSREDRDFFLVFDSDQAGNDRAASLMPQFFREGLKAWRVIMPEDCKDPDELILKHGPEAMEQALESARPLVEWAIEYRLGVYEKQNKRGLTTVMGRRGALKDVAPLLALVQDQKINATVADRLGLDLKQVKEVVATASPPPRGEPLASLPLPEPESATPYAPTKEVTHLLWLLTHRMDEIQTMTGSCARMLGDDHAPIHPILRRLLAGESPSEFLEDLPSPVLKRLMSRVMTLDYLYEPGQACRAWCEVLERLTRPARDLQRARLRQQATEESNDQDACLNRLQQLQQQNLQLQSLLKQHLYPEVIALLEESFMTDEEGE
jgi:DNA primase